MATSLLEPDSSVWNTPLLLKGDDTPDALRPDPQADALGQTYSAITDYMARQQAESARMGLWDDQAGLPTQKGLLDAIGQTGTAVALGTGSAGDAPAPGYTAYHGSPHIFPPTERNPLGEFDPAKIGTGEGNQAFGVGAGYLADAEGVARGYRDNISAMRNPVTIAPEFRTALNAEDNLGFDTPGQAVAAMRAHPDWPARWDVENPDALAALFDAHEAVKAASKGHMYEVNVNADPATFLDWDKPLSEQHPDVQGFFNGVPGIEDTTTGAEAYRMLGRGQEHELSAALQRSGSSRHPLLDANSSRGAGQGTKNTVVFDPATMDIIRRYGLAGLMAGGGAAALGGQSGQQQ